MKENLILGVDVGGSGIKGGIVDTDTGMLLTERYKFATPKPATPAAVAETIKKLVDYFAWDGPVGCGFPSIIRKGVTITAANIDKSWIGEDITLRFEQTCGLPFYVLNDADAAGLAEVAFGAGKGVKGTVMMITIGSGIGTGLFLDGKLLPNSEFGHLFFKNMLAEHYTSSATKDREGLDMETWAKRLNEYLHHLDRLLSVDLYIIGGGISRMFDDFKGFLDVDAAIVPATFQNNAGTIGAAYYARLCRETGQ
jgi:polyphosphate glucokinase